MTRAPGRVGVDRPLAGNIGSGGERDAQKRRGGVEAENPLHGLERTVNNADKQGCMKAHRNLAAIPVCLALALGGTGLAGCGDASTDVEPASLQEIQQEMNEALDSTDQGKKAQKRAKKEAERAAEAEQNITDALDDAQEQAEGDIANPSY